MSLQVLLAVGVQVLKMCLNLGGTPSKPSVEALHESPLLTFSDSLSLLIVHPPVEDRNGWISLD